MENVKVLNHEAVVANPDRYDKPVVVKAYREIIDNPKMVSGKTRLTLIERLRDIGIERLKTDGETIRSILTKLEQSA